MDSEQPTPLTTDAETQRAGSGGVPLPPMGNGANDLPVSASQSIDQLSTSTTTMASAEPGNGIHGPPSVQSQSQMQPVQTAYSASTSGGQPRTANTSAPQTPMMDVESSNNDPGRPVGPAPMVSSAERPLNVTDALSYLDAVKSRFMNRTDVYNRFLDIMKDFKTQVIDTPGVIERVSQLFNSHSDLINGFNTFLPVGYRIETNLDGSVIVRTPQGMSTIPTYVPPGPAQIAPPRNAPSMHAGPSSAHGMGMTGQPGPYHRGAPLETSHGPMNVTAGSPPNPYPPPSYADNMEGSAVHSRESASDRQTEFQRAIGYVNKIKIRFNHDPETYKTFLELLQRHQDAAADVQPQMMALLKNDPDLLAEFKEFWPDGRTNLLGSAVAAGNPGDWSSHNKRKEASSSFTAPPPKRKKKIPEPEPLPTKPTSTSRPVKKLKRPQRTDPMPEEYYENGTRMPTVVGNNAGLGGPLGSAVPDDQAFFERVKKTLENRETYDEFLKLVNMFSQDIIDMRTLVDKATTFLGDGTDLSTLFRRILGWEERERLVREPDDPAVPARQNTAIYVPHGKDDLHHKCGPSYRRIPVNEAHIACSGRDELCRSVLNDEWVSHPTWASEDNSGFQSHKKNAYEEALHKCEEERHEFDFHLEIMSKTISALENINMKIQQMSNEEKSTFKLKPGLGLPNKSIYQRIIKKVYGKEPGMEVVTTLHDCPAVAVPIVLNRLKAKDEDWRKAQREWNKVWREIDARNFYKSLDHQGVTFKSTDKKALTTKALVAAIEAARDEQISERAKLLDPSLAKTKPVHQLAYRVADLAVLKDTTKLILAYLDRLGATYSLTEREKIEKWLINLLVTFFMLDKNDFDEGLKFPQVSPGNDAAAAVSALGVTNMVPVDAGGLSMELDSAAVESDGLASGRRTPTKKSKAQNGVGVNSNDLRKSLLSRTTSGVNAKASSTKASPGGTPMDLPAPTATTSTDGNNDALPVDNVWINTHSDIAQPPMSSTRTSATKGERKATFFANTNAYVILRIFQTLYSRLLLFKELAAALATEKGSHTANPIALELGLLDGLGPGTMNLFAPVDESEIDADGAPFNPVARFYDHTLECCESLFVGDMDQSTFEENLRFMFGSKGYLLFTVDKAIAALVKQIHAAIADPHTEELLTLLKKERQAEAPSTQQIITYRRNAEEITGQDDNLFRINWDQGVMTMQLLGKSDPSTDDVETIAQRWRFYIESYVLTHPTEALRREVRNPFLRRNVVEAPLTETGCDAHNGLEVRVCLRTYRLFFVSDTEDFFWRYGDGARKQAMEKVPEIEEKRKASFDSWLEARRARKDKVRAMQKTEVVPIEK